MTDQNEKLDDELLSAYVDGELTGEQLAQVEQRLANDPLAQQLVDELRALSQELQSLPKQAVGEDLRSTVMQRAERAMLLGTDEQQASRPPDGASSSRRWMWPAMALAATLLLTLYLPNAQQEEKPLASAKSVPDEPKQAEPYLEAVAAEETSEAELVAQGGEGGEVGGAYIDSVADRMDEADPPVAIRARSAMSSPSPSAAGFATAEATSKPVVDEFQPDFQVFLALNDNADGFEQFNQLLVSNGITLENNDVGEENQSGLGDKDAGTTSATRHRDVPKELSEAQLSEHEEVVLVEATTEQIENLLEAYNADVQNFASVRLLAKEKATGQKTTSLPLEKWRQWERSGKQLAQNKLRKLKQAKQTVKQSQLGRAMRLDASQFQRQGNGVLNFEQNLLSKNASPSKLAAKSPVQVLFILQQISKSQLSEPAATGVDR